MGGKQVTFTESDRVVRRCYVCKELKDLNEFSSIREYRCKLCNNERNRERDKEYRRKLYKIKLESGCVDCGYNAHAEALQFDHLPGFNKEFELTKAARYSWDKVEAEMAKCKIVCANCHAIRTAYRRLPDWSMLIDEGPYF